MTASGGDNTNNAVHGQDNDSLSQSPAGVVNALSSCTRPADNGGAFEVQRRLQNHGRVVVLALFLLAINGIFLWLDPWLYAQPANHIPATAELGIRIARLLTIASSVLFLGAHCIVPRLLQRGQPFQPRADTPLPMLYLGLALMMMSAILGFVRTLGAIEGYFLAAAATIAFFLTLSARMFLALLVPAWAVLSSIEWLMATDKSAVVGGIVNALLMAGLFAAIAHRMLGFRRAIHEARVTLAAQRQEIAQVNKELKRSLDKSRSAGVAKSRFLAMMSHEIRTPLHGVLGVAELLELESENPNVQKRASKIQRLANTLLELLTDILDYSRFESGVFTLRKLPFSPKHLLDAVRDTMAPQAQARGLGIRVHLDPRLPAKVLGDETRLKQIFFNLVSNAIKFSESGDVQIRFELGDDASVPKDSELNEVPCRLVVQDNGQGISEEEQKKIFHAFVQVDDEDGDPRRGAGLGLPIVRELVQAMGGQIQVTSQRGHGTTIAIDVPLMHPPQASAKAPARTVTRRDGSATIMVVDDNPMNLEVAQAQLQLLGYRTLTFTSGPEVLDALAKETPSALLVDVRMHPMSGHALTEAVRQSPYGQGGSLPIIGVSAEATQEERERCLQAGMDAFLTKPVSLDEMRAELDIWVGGQTPHLEGSAWESPTRHPSKPTRQ